MVQDSSSLLALSSHLFMHEIKQNSALALGALGIVFEKHNVHQATGAAHEHHAPATLGAARVTGARLSRNTRTPRGDFRGGDGFMRGLDLPTWRGQVEFELELRT